MLTAPSSSQDLFTRWIMDIPLSLKPNSAKEAAQI